MNKALIILIGILLAVIGALSINQLRLESKLEAKESKIAEQRVFVDLYSGINQGLRDDIKELNRIHAVNQRIIAENRKFTNYLQLQNNKLSGELIEAIDENAKLKDVFNTDVGANILRLLWENENGSENRSGVCETPNGLSYGNACSPHFGLYELKIKQVFQYTLKAQTALNSCNADKKAARDAIALMVKK